MEETRPEFVKKFNNHNYREFFKICRRTAACLEYTLLLDTQLFESTVSGKGDPVKTIDNVLNSTYKNCFEALVPDYRFFGFENQPEKICYIPSNSSDRIDPFRNSIRSQCLLSSYDTIAQLLYSNYKKAAKLTHICTEKGSTFPHGIQGFYMDPNTHLEKVDKAAEKNNDNKKEENSDDANEADPTFDKKGRTKFCDIVIQIYSSLLSSEKALESCDIGLYSKSISHDNDYHRLVLPSSNLMRYFQFKNEGNTIVKFHFTYKLIGPECVLKNGKEPLKPKEEDVNDPGRKTFIWESEELDIDDFPFAKEIGTYEFSLSISVAKRGPYKNTKIQKPTFFCKIKINGASKKDSPEQDTAPQFKELESDTKRKEILPLIEYYPINLSCLTSDKLFLTYNADFFSHFTKTPPSRSGKVLRMLYEIPTNCKKEIDEALLNFDDSTPNNDQSSRECTTFSIPKSDNPVDKLYSKYQFERLTGHDAAMKLYDLLRIFSDKGIILSDEELDILCEIGSSRDIFSRDFILKYTLYPLLNRKDFLNNVLDKEIEDDSPVRFSRKDIKYSRDKWHKYAKMFLKRWNRLIVPACEWFFLLTLLQCYDIDFNELCTRPDEDETAFPETKLATLFGELSAYIEKYEKQLSDPLTDDSGETIDPFDTPKPSDIKSISPFSQNRIMAQIASHNKMHVLNLSENKESPVYLNSLVVFDKDTLLSKNNENVIFPHLKQIQQTYTHFLYDDHAPAKDTPPG